MKRSAQILFIVLFLAVIYMVPVSQTIYEYCTNSNHHIQMLDLVEDVVVTPVKHAKADTRSLDSLVIGLDSIGAQIARARGAGQTSVSSSWDPAAAASALDDASLRVSVLRKNVVDYDRHIEGDHNRFAKKDTLAPYFRALQATQAGLDSLRAQIQAGDLVAAGDAFGRVHAQAKQARELFAGGGSRLKLALIAMRRTLVGADYLRPYEKEMEKSSIFANGVRPWMLLAHYAFFGDLGDKGVQGRNGWSFYRPDVEYLSRPYVRDPRSAEVDPNDAPIRDSIVDSIVTFKRQLSARGIDLLVVIMPGKPSIYPDLVSERMPASAAGTFSHSLRMIADLRNAGIATVDLFKAFAAERTNDTLAGDSLYLHTDTHFRGRAVRLTAKVIADRVRQYAWYQPGDAEYVIDTLRVARQGDIGEMTKLPSMGLRGLHFSFPAESTTCYQVWRLERDAAGGVAGRTLYRDEYQHSAILVIGDSFSRIYQTDEPRSAGWISHLALELRQPVASVVNDGGASTLVRQTLARKPALLRGRKLVVWEIVERDFRFGAEGWKNVAL